MQKLVDAMGSGPFHTLQDSHQGKGPAIRAAQRQEQQMNMVRHYHGRMEVDPVPVLTHGMPKDQVAGGIRKGRPPQRAESHEQIAIRLL